MKFTSYDLMKAMGLQIGNKIRIKTKELEKYTFLVDDGDGLMLVYEGYEYPIGYLLDHEYEILPRPKRVGDLKCKDFECCDCPLQYICCLDDWGFTTNDNLFNILELFDCDDQEIYDLLKARLDKEVE